MEEKEVLPIEDHIKVLINGEAQNDPCEISPDEEFELPPWFDKNKYKRGQMYIQENIFSQFTCTLAGLIAVLSIPSILNILIKTNKSSCFHGAYRRYISTIFHVFTWYKQDLNPSTDAWKSLMAVRTRHFKASKCSKLRGDGFITQRDMALTQFGFLGIGLLCPSKIGMKHNNQDDIEGYLHFWRTIGYMLGLKDKYNLCRPSIEESKILFDTLRKEIFCYHLRYPPEYFYAMSSAVLRSMWYYSPALSEGGFMYFIMLLMGVEGYSYNWNMNKFSVKLETDSNNSNMAGFYPINNNIENDKMECYEKPLGLYNRMLLHLYHIVHNLVNSYYLGRLHFNNNTNMTIFLLKNFPFLSIIRFGIRGAYINMFKEEVPMRPELKTNKEMFELRNY